MSSGNWPPKPPMPCTMAAHALDGGITGGDVHPGAGVGGAALSHDAQTPGSAPWWAPDRAPARAVRRTPWHRAGTGVG